MSDEPQMMTTGQCATFLGITRFTLRRWHAMNCAPPRALKGKRYYYALEAVKEWLRHQGRDEASCAAPSARPGAPPPRLSAAFSSPLLDLPRKSR